jgi:predicted metalloendopeptidase
MKVLRELLDAAAAAPEPLGSITQKVSAAACLSQRTTRSRSRTRRRSQVGDFDKAAMDLGAVEAAGIAPLAELLRLADAAADGSMSLAAALGELHTAGVPVFFGLGDGPDAKDSGRSIAQAHQGGLGLPDRDYYFESCHAEIKTKYEAHVARMLRLLGDDEADAGAAAAAVVALETRLAGAQLTRTERRDPDKTYNKTTLPALASASPGLDWPLYFTAIDKASPGDINVDCPAALTAAAAAAAEATPHALRSYLRWHIVNAAAEYLGDAFSGADFEFYAATLSGQKEQKPRWKRALAKVNAHLGEALGQLYVEKVFPADAKARAGAVVLAVRDALQARLGALPWLADATRQRCGRLACLPASCVCSSSKQCRSRPLPLFSCLSSAARCRRCTPSASKSASPTRGSTTRRSTSPRGRPGSQWCSPPTASSTAARWRASTRPWTARAG